MSPPKIIDRRGHLCYFPVVTTISHYGSYMAPVIALGLYACLDLPLASGSLFIVVPLFVLPTFFDGV